jgi:hypothetical protein
MNRKIRAVTAMLGGALFTGLGTHAVAADHAEAPGTQADFAADIADIYAWHNGSGQIVVALTFAGGSAAGVPATYDADVLYAVHVDTTLDGIAEHDIYFRFGSNLAGGWGIQAEGIPGADPLVSGPVETSIDTELTSTLKLWAGLRDDPFFFDVQGFGDTLAKGTLLFDPTRDGFAGKNVTAIVFTMDQATALGSDPTMKVWATTGRL